MTPPSPHPPNTPDWLVTRVDEHSNRLQGVEREVMGLHTKHHGLEIRLSALSEKLTEGQAANSTKIDQIAKTLDAMRVKQLEDAAVTKALAEATVRSREGRKELGAWVRWIAPGVLTVLLILITLGDKAT